MTDIVITVCFSAILFVLAGLTDHHCYPRFGMLDKQHADWLDSVIDSF